MGQQFLPGEVRDRMIDLMKARGISQTALAEMAGCNKSTISRFLTGQIEKLSDESIIGIANGLDISTDFLLGVANHPDRTNYDLEELGLSVEAGKALYTSKTNAAAINALLESKSFPALAQLLKQYIEGTTAEGYAAQNQMYANLASMLAGENSDAASAIKSLQMPVYQADMTHIENIFHKILLEIRGENKEALKEAKALTNSVMAEMIGSLPKNTAIPAISADLLVDAMVAPVASTGLYSEKQIAGFRKGVMCLFQNPAEDIGDDGTEQ